MISQSPQTERPTLSPQLCILTVVDNKGLVDLCGSAEAAINDGILYMDHVHCLAEAAVASQMTSYDLAIIDARSAGGNTPIELEEVRVPFIALMIDGREREGIQAWAGEQRILLKFVPSAARLAALIRYALRVKDRELS